MWKTHKWGKWSKAVNHYSLNLTQARICESCGKIETRVIKVEHLGGDAASKINEALKV